MNALKFALFLTPLLAFAQAQNYVSFTFDPPRSTDTSIAGLNNSGVLVGSYTDLTGVHNFILAADGLTYSSVDAPGALPGTTIVTGVNNLGQVIGTFRDATGARGYIRAANGQAFTTLEPTLIPKAINDRGDVVGQIEPSGLVAQAFVRTADGRVTRLPGWSYANGINTAGDVVGWTHTGTNGVDHGFLRHADGSTETIDVPGIDGRTRLYSINNQGQIAGTVDGHVFVRNANGTFATFDVPLTPLTAANVAINDSGRLAGSYLDGNRSRGFTADPTSVSTIPAIRGWAGILSASGFGGVTATAPGSWIEIYGQNLARSTRQWRLADFNGGVAPTSLDGVTVRINGRPAFLFYISATQINALVPTGTLPGTAQVIVDNGDRISVPYAIVVNALTPGLLVTPLVNAVSRNVVALFLDGVAVGPSRRAKTGDTIVLYGIGFGPVVPETPIGQIATASIRLQADLEIRFNGVPATVSYAGLAPESVGLYQLNVVVPGGVLAEGQTSSDSVAVTLKLNDAAIPLAPQVLQISIER